MNGTFSPMKAWAFVIGSLTVLLACGSTNHLKDYTFQGLTMSAMISAPQPEVFTGSFAHVDPDDMLISALRLGTGLAKEITAEGARQRLRSAMIRVDVPEAIRQQALKRCSHFLHLRPVQDEGQGDILMDMVIDHYGIDADTWDGGAYFEIKMKVLLIDQRADREIWEAGLEERQLLSPTFFPTPEEAAGDIITAVSLSQVSSQEMAAGLEQLAEDMADRLARRLRKDYLASRQGKLVAKLREAEPSSAEQPELSEPIGHLYQASAEQVQVVDVPPLNYLMIDGAGDPNTSPEYRQAIEALQAVSQALQLMLQERQGIASQATPLEGLWWADDPAQFTPQNKGAWKWTAMIRQPDEVTHKMVAEAVRQISTEALPGLSKVRLETLQEGPSAQIVHIGPYEQEGPTVGKIHGFIFGHGHRPRGKHHEIYLRDPAQCPPELLRTIIRQPFE